MKINAIVKITEEYHAGPPHVFTNAEEPLPGETAEAFVKRVASDTYESVIELRVIKEEPC